MGQYRIGLVLIVAALLVGACSGASTTTPAVDSGKVTTRQVLNNQTLAGQEATCAGPREKSVAIQVLDKTLDLGLGFKTATWTYGETSPGPVIEACVGDTVTITLENTTDVAHGLDSHAFKIDAAAYATDSFTGTLDTPGVYMYHCASGPTTDLHIKSGMVGAMIVYPRDQPLRPAKEMVIVQGALFGDPDAEGNIPRDTKRMMDNNPFSITFNGTLVHEPIAVEPDDLVRVYFVNPGPGDSAVHVIGTILDKVYSSGNPANVVSGVQTDSVAAGSGAIIEFRIPSAGTFVFVDHDNLRHLSFGAAIPFVAK